MCMRKLRLCSALPQDPLNLSQRAIEAFHHVKTGLEVEAPPPEESSSLRNASEDMRRALSALATPEASAAFSAGGGGRKAQAERALAEAQVRPELGFALACR